MSKMDLYTPGMATSTINQPLPSRGPNEGCHSQQTPWEYGCTSDRLQSGTPTAAADVAAPMRRL